MDARLIVLLGGLGLLGFLFAPRQETDLSPGAVRWIETAERVEGEPLRTAGSYRPDPPIETRDLGFIYMLGRAELQIENSSENGPRVYEITLSAARGGPYRRVFTYRGSSRNYPYTVQRFPESHEGRWAQVVVNDWFSGRPKVTSFRLGPEYRRDWNPIRKVAVSHNSKAAKLLIDGLTSESSKWAGARFESAEPEEGEEGDGPTDRPVAPDSDVWIVADLGARKTVHGVRLTTDGPGDNARSYRVSASSDGAQFSRIAASSVLPDETQRSTLSFREPVEARYIRFDLEAWHGSFPEVREVEAFTEQYRLPESNPPFMEDNNPILIRHDNCGYDNRRAPHLLQGFAFDRGDGRGDPADRFTWRDNEDIEGAAPEAHRSFAYHYDTLRFQYDGLEPDRLYWLRVVYLQNNGGQRAQNLIVDGYLLHGDEAPIPSSSPTPQAYAVPADAVSDGRISVEMNRLSGANAVISEISLFEATTGGDETAPSPTRFFRITRSAVSKAIDGRLTDWDRLYPMAAEGDRAPTAFAEWDDDALYVAARIPRAALPGQIGVEDTLDLFIDSKHSRSPSLYRQGDVHLRVFRIGGGNETVRFVTHYSDETEPRDDLPPVEIASRREGDRYSVEMRLPREGLLDDWEPALGGLIGFNYILSNRDGQSWQWAAPRPDDPPIRWRTSRLIGSIRATARIVAQPSESEPVVARPDGAFHAGDVLWLVVVDPDANRDPNARDSISVSIEGDGIGESRDVTLLESVVPLATAPFDPIPSTDSETFVGFIPTSYGAASAGRPDRIAARGGETLTLSYRDRYAHPNGSDVIVRASSTAATGSDARTQIIDADGVPISSFRSGDTLRFRVADDDLTTVEESDEPAPAEIELTARATAQGETFDAETVTLTAAQDGAYESELATEYGETPIPDDGALQVVGGQRVEAVYVDPLRKSGRANVPVVAAAGVEIGATARLRVRRAGESFSSNPNETTLFRSGEPLIVRIEDADLDLDESAIDEATITVEGNALGDSLAMEFEETGPNTGIFEGVIRTQYANRADNTNAALEVAGGEAVSIHHIDALQGSGATNIVTDSLARTQTGYDATLSLVRSDYVQRLTRVNAGDPVYIRVEERDEIGYETFVTLSSASAGDRETARLTVSTAAPSEYIGSIETAYSTMAQPGDGVLQAVGNDTIRAEYNDTIRASGETDIVVTATAQANVGNNGALRVMADADVIGASTPQIENFRAASFIVVEVRDQDLNASSEAIERAEVEAFEDFLGDNVTLTLRETSGNSGVFRASLQTEYADAPLNDDILQVQGRSLVTIRYVDALQSSGEAQIPLTATLYVESGRRGTLNALTLDGERQVGNLNPGDTALIRVVDSDLNEDASFAESTAIDIVGLSLNDRLRLPLRETGLDTGVFEARLATELAQPGASPDLNDMLLQVIEKEAVAMTYVDALTDAGETNAVVQTTLLIAGSSPGVILITDAYGDELGAFRAGDTLYIALQDLLLTSTRDVTEVRVAVFAEESGDRVDLALRPIPGEDGAFWGTVPTRYSVAASPDGTLDVRGGETVRAVYSPPWLDASVPVSDTCVVERGSRGEASIIRPDGALLRELTPGDALNIRVVDADRNQDAFVVDSMEVRVSVAGKSNVFAATLLETDVNTGVFKGSVETTFGATADAEGAITLLGGETVVVTYDDPLSDTGQTNIEITTTARARRVGFAPFTREPVVLDGIADQWPLENVMSSDDGSALVWAQWDRDALYLFAQIADDEMAVKDVTRWFEGSDALEIHLHTEPTSAERPSHLNLADARSSVAFWICPRGGGINGDRPYVGRAAPSIQYNVGSVEAAAREQDGSYYLEIRLPFHTALAGLDPLTSARRNRLGFNFLLYRSDAPQVWWADPIDQPSAAGILYLERGPEATNRTSAHD